MATRIPRLMEHAAAAFFSSEINTKVGQRLRNAFFSGQVEPLRFYSHSPISVQAMLWQVLELSLLSREYGGLEVHADLVMSCKLY